MQTALTYFQILNDTWSLELLIILYIIIIFFKL